MNTQTEVKAMNALENYKNVLEQYFGTGAATFDTASGATNNVIGALNHKQFHSFRLAFYKRLKRLSARYKANINLPPLLSAVNEIASTSNWAGAYAELVALDFLNSDADYLPQPISLSRTVLATETLASNLGMTNVNFDGYYDDFDVCFDVKVLSDKSGAILEGIISQVIQSLNIPSATISPEYPLDLDFTIFQNKRSALYNELAAAINSGTKPTYVKSIVEPKLSYRIIWGGGVLSTVSTYDPFQHADNHHRLLFKHTKKFSKNQPSLIVFVIFPWYSGSTSFIGSADVFYRAFCRRFFCQYAKDNNSAKTILPSFQGTETVAQVTDKLAGVLFLEDGSIETPNPDQQNVKGFAVVCVKFCNLGF